ncbi:unnamed protein product [Caenorhabditis brenneri]
MIFRCWPYFIFFAFQIVRLSNAVKCYRDNGHIELYNQTCEGDFCIAIRSGAFTTLRMTRTCVSGIKMPSYPCSLQWDDEMTCYCNTDYCNTDKIFWSNFTEFPVISCKQVHNRKYMMVSCNKCLRIISYVKNRIGMSNSDDEDHVLCSVLGDSGDFVDYTNSFKEEMIARSFFVNGCYNTSMHRENYYVYCRCTQPDCNSPEVPIPYPLPAPSVSCYTSGFDAYAYPEKYEKPKENWFVDNYRKLMANDSYVDPNSVCRGQFCFVATVAADAGENEMDIYYKGCISANETGENRIQLGYMYLNEIAYYICNTDYCNVNREVALREAKNSTIKVVRSIEKVDKNNARRLSSLFIALVIVACHE